MSIKMIVTDLDQTLLRTDKTISDYTIEILRTCQQQGIIVSFATARSETDCKQYISKISPDAIISNRGALVRAGNNVISSTTIDTKTTNNLLSSCLKNPNVGYIYVYTEKGYFMNLPADKHDPSWGTYNKDMYTNFSQGLSCDSYKITIEVFDDTAAYTIAANFPMLSVVKFSGEPWFSFANISVNKIEGVKTLAAHFNIDLNDVVSFGDDFSDIEMIRECGIGVAVGNAINEVKNAAKYICDTNDCDGVAKWIQKAKK